MVPEIPGVLNVGVRVLGAIPLGALVSEVGGEPRERAAVAMGRVDSSMEVDDGGNATLLRDYCREGNIPWKNMPARKEVQPLYK